jgi:hypothetical protein
LTTDADTEVPFNVTGFSVVGPDGPLEVKHDINDPDGLYKVKGVPLCVDLTVDISALCYAPISGSITAVTDDAIIVSMHRDTDNSVCTNTVNMIAFQDCLTQIASLAGCCAIYTDAIYDAPCGR